MSTDTELGQRRVLDVVIRFRDAYLARDLEAMLALFSEDARLTAAPGEFGGKDEVRGFLSWEAELSPTVTADDAGVGVTVAGPSAAVWERVLHLSFEGIPYDEEVVTVFQLDSDGLICRYRSYYDKLAVVQQIAAGLPGVGGWVTKQVVDVVVAAGNPGLVT